jgi:membrane-associated phospholipid phosphatase
VAFPVFRAGHAVRRVTFLAAALVLASRLAAASVFPEAIAQFRRDLTALVTVEGKPTSTEVAAALAVFGVLAATDERGSVAGREHLPSWIDRFEPGGRTAVPTMLGASLLAGGLAFGDHRTLLGGATLVEGNVILDLALQLSKGGFGRQRPNRSNANHWFSGGDSFPSSHAAHAFLIASVLDATIDEPAWRWVLYPLATGVALQRVHEGVHYPTDVVAGGLLGWWIGHRLAVAHDLVEGTPGPQVAFVPVRGGGALVVTVGWK